MRLEQVVGQFLVGPVGPVQALLGGPADDPLFDLLGLIRRDAGRFAPGLLGPQSGPAEFAVGVEPTADAAGADAQVGGDVLSGPAPVGQQYDLESVAVLAFPGGAELRLQLPGLGRG